MRKISIIANQALATRQFLRTPIFDLLQAKEDNLITVYTPAKRLRKEIRFKNVRIRGNKFFFDLKKSDIIVVPEWESEVSRWILEKAEKWEIPTLFVQGGTGAPSSCYKTDLYPTRICAWGDMYRRVYIERGIDPDRIVVTGEPRFDWYYQLEKERLFSTDKKILLYTPQSLQQSPEHWPNFKETISKQFDIIYKISQEFKIQLICKVHPSDNPDLYKREGVIVLTDTGVSSKNYITWYCNTGYDPKVSDLKRLGQIFSSCDVATTIFSTTGLEAMILGKPVIFFDSAGYYKRFKIHRLFIERCSFALATNEREFSGLLQKYLKDPNADSEKRKEVVFDFAYKQDGQASRRVVDAIEEILNKKE